MYNLVGPRQYMQLGGVTLELKNIVSAMCFGLIQPASNFYIWFGKQQYQDDQTGVKPPSYTVWVGQYHVNKDYFFIINQPYYDV